MYELTADFAYASRRACQEQVAAINACCDAAEGAHRRMSHRFAARAQRAATTAHAITLLAGVVPIKKDA